MGYYTSFTLTVPYDAPLDIIEQFREKYGGAAYCLTNTGDSNERGKWYSFKDDLVAFSKKYPAVRFELEGEGEEAGDLWKLYALNGKSQLCKAVITYPPYDESKLK